MRIALDRRRLLGFRSRSESFDVSVIAAKVGNKPTIGIRIASACHSRLADTPVAIDGIQLIYPAGTGR